MTGKLETKSQNEVEYISQKKEKEKITKIKAVNMVYR